MILKYRRDARKIGICELFILANLNEERYGFANFFELPQQPVVDRVFYKGGKEIKCFSL